MQGSCICSESMNAAYKLISSVAGRYFVMLLSYIVLIYCMCCIFTAYLFCINIFTVLGVVGSKSSIEINHNITNFSNY